MSDSDLVRATGLWLADGKAGEFFSGEFRQVDPGRRPRVRVQEFQRGKRPTARPHAAFCGAEDIQPTAMAPAELSDDIPF